MKKIKNLFVIICIFGIICFSFIFVGCSSVPLDYQGVYTNVSVGSQWIVHKSTAESPQAMLYNYEYNGKTYPTFIVWDVTSSSLTISQSVNVTSALLGGSTGVPKANKVDVSGAKAASAYSGEESLQNISLNLTGYQIRYRDITYLVVSGCQHVLLR